MVGDNPESFADLDGHCDPGLNCIESNFKGGIAAIGNAYAKVGKALAAPVGTIGAGVGDIIAGAESGNGQEITQGFNKIGATVTLIAVAPEAGGAEPAAAEEGGILANAEKGAASEARVLSDIGQAKNTEAVAGSEGKSIPDFQNAATIGEIKDAKTVSNTRQLRIQKGAAQASGRQHELYTGTNTHVTSNAEQGTKVIRRDDLGPQQ